MFDAGEIDPQTITDVAVMVSVKRGRRILDYKPRALERAIQLRVLSRASASLQEYLHLLASDLEECDALVDTLFANVTAFFRDPGAFAGLERALSSRMSKSTSDFRVWVAGCSSGEEAYSIAMLLHELAERAAVASEAVTVFATDTDADSVGAARLGHYRESIEGEVSGQRLHRWFVRAGGGYRVCDELRRSVVFSVHDLLADPPLPDLDLISCRNVLIYFEREPERRLLSEFHRVLRERALLFLGSAESTTAAPHLFDAVDARCRIFCRR